MSLLPLNSKNIDQNFAEIIDTRSRVDFSDVSVYPLTCDASLLPHIAFSKGANINNMLESEARAYLKAFNRKYIGTVGAVEDASKVYFDIPRVVEWFEDSSLSKGEFSVNLKIVDNCREYDSFKLEKTRQLINKAKNVRSKLKDINIEYLSKNLSVMSIGFVAENKSDLSMHNEYIETVVKDERINIGIISESFCYIKMEGM